MTRFEKGKQDIKVLAKMICEFVETRADENEFCCDGCPWEEDCGYEHNGVEAWLKGKVKE